jgi:hypothetical protein
VATVFEQFLSEELNADSRAVVFFSFHNAQGKVKDVLEFNRFEVEMNYLESTVTILDVLNATEEGRQVVSLVDFMSGIS